MFPFKVRALPPGMTQEEFQQLITDGIGSDPSSLDPLHLQRNIVVLIEHAKDADGNDLTIDAFRARGIRNERELRDEAADEEILLKLLWGEQERRLVKLQTKVDTDIYAEGCKLVEKSRTYLWKDNLVVPSKRKKGVRGTARRGKSIREDAAREVRQECEIDCASENLFLRQDAIDPNPLERRKRRESEVYWGIQVIDIVNRFFMFLPKKPWPYWDTKSDRGVIVHFEWEPVDDVPVPHSYKLFHD